MNFKVPSNLTLQEIFTTLQKRCNQYQYKSATITTKKLNLTQTLYSLSFSFLFCSTPLKRKFPYRLVLLVFYTVRPQI